MSTSPEVVQLGTPQELAGEAARRFVTLAGEAIAQRGSFIVALSGGSTPKALYAQLAAAPLNNSIDWSKVHVFFSDERFVPPDSEESNYHTARVGLLSRVPIPAEQVHPYATEHVSPQDSAAAYESEIRASVPAGNSSLPEFDLILLGMGPDGHTASLFPGTAALAISDRLVAPNYVDKLQTWRLTFTYPLINGGRTVMFLVAGDDKKERVREVLSGGSSLPAARVAPDRGRLVWLLDAAAAAEYDAATTSGDGTQPA